MKSKDRKKINKKIIEFLKSTNGAYYGNLIMELDEDTLSILEQLISLKKQGLVYKDNDGGKFRVKNSHKLKSEETQGEDKNAEWDVVDEMNSFSKSAHKKEKKIDNEISINKQVPNEQKVKPNKSNP
ncbi:MAG: hypothetical protein RQ761_05435 [Bacteroidales bacterium]|nr:hypothetical protein [Bacteroidales bacterium]